MKLYHYTSVSLGEAILSSAISEGHLMHSNGDMSHHVVWLTADPHPGGHGLTIGNEKLTESQQEHMKRVQHGSVSNYLTQDKTQIRFTVELEPEQLPKLMSFMSYCDTYENKLFAKWYGVSCLVDARTVSEKELKRLMRTASTKERTWWLSFEPVPATAFRKIEFKVKGKYEPYDFERHGREVMRRLGFAYPSQAAQAEIQSIVDGAHALEVPKASVFCEDPAKPAKVGILGGGTRRVFEIATGALVIGAEDALSAPLRAWIDKHRTELDACSAEAVEIYYSYYPARRPVPAEAARAI